MKELTSRQFIFITLFAMLSTKILTIQPLVYEHAGKDSIWSIFLGMVFDFSILIFVVWLLQKHKDISFYDLLKKTFGTVVTKILLVFMFVFILLKALFLYQETYSYFLQILFTEIPLLVYVIPALFVTGYFAVKGITTIARSMEIFSVFIIIGVLVCTLTAIDGVSTDYILPFFENGISPTLEGFEAQIFYRGNAIMLLLFMGKIDFNKHFNLKFYSYNIALRLAVLGIGLLFYMVYGPSVKYVEFTLADLPQYDPFVSDLGRFNWLSLVICTLALFLTSSTFLYLLALIGRWVFNLKRSFIPTCISIAVVVILAYINQFSLTVMSQKVASEWQYITVVILAMFMLLTIILLCVRRQKWTKC